MNIYKTELADVQRARCNATDTQAVEDAAYLLAAAYVNDDATCVDHGRLFRLACAMSNAGLARAEERAR